jgi:lipopolysaccharide transport system ATP-binding protein
MDSTVLWALKDVDFEVKKGDSLGLVGPNGAGKTTLLKLLARITTPSSGTITRNGTLSALIELGAGFHPELTGRDNVFLNGTILGMSREEIRRRFDEIVAFADIDRFIDTPVKRYSSGMAVRLGFAVASCMNPEVLLVDEVLAVGDALFQQKCLSRLSSLAREGSSIIFVSHNLYLVQAACNTALYLKNGTVAMQGSVNDVFHVYESDIHEERVRRFDGATPAGGGDIEITAVEIGDESGKHPSIRSDELTRIRIHYTAYRSLGTSHVSTFILRADGMRCCMMRTRLDGFGFSIERGHGVVELELPPLPLVGGAYYVEASFLDETDSVSLVSAAARSDWFTVLGRAISGDESSVLEPHCIWSHIHDRPLAPQVTLDDQQTVGGGKDSIR